MSHLCEEIVAEDLWLSPSTIQQSLMQGFREEREKEDPGRSSLQHPCDPIFVF